MVDGAQWAQGKILPYRLKWGKKMDMLKEVNLINITRFTLFCPWSIRAKLRFVVLHQTA